MNAIKLKCTGAEEVRIIKQFKYKLHMRLADQEAPWPFYLKRK